MWRIASVERLTMSLTSTVSVCSHLKKLKFPQFLLVPQSVHSITTNPVHIISNSGNLNPSAFIPFCSFAGNMSTLGNRTHNFSVPVCTKFKPKLVKGQQCYILDIASEGLTSGYGPNAGLSFLMDYNTLRNCFILSWHSFLHCSTLHTWPRIMKLLFILETF